MPNLPAHIEQWVSTDDWVCPNCGPTGATYHENCTHCGHPLLPDEVKPKLRAILEAAWEVAQAGSLLRTERMSTLSCSICGWYSDCVEPDPEQLQHTDCPHRKLKEAMSDD